MTGKAPGTLLRELNLLADVGILNRSRIGNQVHFGANPACPVFEELRGIMKKTSGIADVLREALEPVRGRIASAFVYVSDAVILIGWHAVDYACGRDFRLQFF